MADWIPNKGWESGDAGGWTLTQSTLFTNAVQTTAPRTDTYSLIMFRFGTGQRFGKAEYSSPDYEIARGKEVIFTVYRRWYLSSVRYPQTKYIRIDDGVGQTDYNLDEGLGDGFQLQTVTRTIDASATKLDFIIYVAGDDTAHHRLSIDDMNVTVAGSESPAEVYPTDPLARVTGLVHIYDRLKGIYQLEAFIGDVSTAIALLYEKGIGGLTPEQRQLERTMRRIQRIIDEAKQSGLDIPFFGEF